MATKVQCRKCPASVHSTNATWQTNFGVTQRHSFIFSAVNDSPHREAIFSGRFLNGQWTTLSFLRVGKIHVTMIYTMAERFSPLTDL